MRHALSEQGRAVCPCCMEKRTVMMRILAYFREYRWRWRLCCYASPFPVCSTRYGPYLSGTVLYDKVLGQDERFAAMMGTGSKLYAPFGIAGHLHAGD